MPYPEHAKLKAIRDKSQCVSDFLDWLADARNHDGWGAIELAYYPLITERAKYDGDFNVTGYEPIPPEEQDRSSELASLTYRREQLLARFFGIDLHKLEEEKVQMLNEFRDQSHE